MNELSYGALMEGTGTLSLREEGTPYLALTERHMQALWHEGRAFSNLKTLKGEPVIILSPGAWNGEEGPDFIKAEILIGGERLCGDVELHLTEQRWQESGSQSDERYSNVILHLLFWRPQGRVPFCEAAVASLEEALDEPVHRLLEKIDLELYPYKEFVGSGRCAKQLFSQRSGKQLEAFFSGAALWRLSRKKERLSLLCEEEELLFPGALAMALGYPGNGLAFLELFKRLVSLKEVRSDDQLAALALGAAGFFDLPFRSRWRDSPYYEQLLALWKSLPPLPPIPLNRGAVRPHNHPVRRLACLVMLVLDTKRELLYSTLEHQWEHSWRSAPLKALRDSLSALLPAYEDPYWSHHYAFELQRQEKALSLIGENTKIVMLINGFFPLLYDAIKKRGDGEELAAFNRFYGAFPAQKTGKGDYLTHRFFGDSKNSSLLDREKLLQGAYQLHSDFCLHHGESCKGCPFVDRYERTIPSSAP